jgi:Flp pilus assembly protein TadG
MPKASFRNLSALTKLIEDETGQILIYFTILLPVIMGMIGLALEGGRVLMLNSQLQNLADAAALAGARELDGGSDAITRATSAAESLLSNDTWWSNVAHAGIQIQDPPIFYSALKGVPTNNPASADVITSDPTKASFIKVITVTRDVVPAFLVAVGATSIGQTAATATAGSTFVACNVQPLMMCNPFGSNFSENVSPGTLFGFTATGNNSSFSPGVFSLLDPAGQTTSGAPEVAALLSDDSPNFCYADDISPHTGQAAGPVSNGINVRFGINATPSNGLNTAPAPNVIKGDPSNTCASNPKLTSDDDLTSGAPHALPVNVGMTLTTPTGDQGTIWMGGTFDTTRADQYWKDHHEAAGSWPRIDGVPMTRYQIYQMERNELSPPTGVTSPLPWIIGEDPAPHCSTPAGGDSRRIISVAIVNCEPPIPGNSLKTVRSNSYADFFLVRPVDSGSSTTAYPSGVIWAEFIRMVTPKLDSGQNGKLHQIVQLYRDR